MSEVKRYTPVVNGASFIGMAEIGRDGYWAGPDVGPFMPSSDYDAAIAAKDAEIERLRAALRDITHVAPFGLIYPECYKRIQAIVKAALAAAETEVKPIARTEPWVCGVCGQKNSAWATKCGRCDTLDDAKEMAHAQIALAAAETGAEHE